ncbi:hypothetical protein AZG88_45430 [Rhodococcus sp. LB1]|nr:GAF domain-containing protein [Rhodococcus sp. LB1]KXX58496.1 hypothetical protein AZG88_45430 [Rhodococcus sp. LB1]RZL75889.1 MAG: GAF domain-containing protein [Rhodococcus sp. (in: high G+C Gram-positive bacteria)]
MRSYLSAPLRLDNDRVGALNLYNVDDHGFSDLDAALLKISIVGETIIPRHFAGTPHHKPGT